MSCIYGLGTPQEYVDRMVRLRVGDTIERDQLLRRFVDVQYTRNDLAFTRGTFRVRGDTVEVFPVYEELAVRVEMFGDEIERVMTLHPLTGEVVEEHEEVFVFPATHYVAGPERMERAIAGIELELADSLAAMEAQGKLLEAQRLRMRTTYDVEMMRQVGFCNGIENYSRHIDGRAPGTAPHTLLDYFPEDFLLVIDESHVTVPQIGAMYEGDRSRKRTLVDHGFRLPSAMDNRPLKWEEFLERVGQTVHLSATPGPYELSRVRDDVVEQVIRPTGLVDPEIVVKPTKGQIDDLVHEIRLRAERDERVLVTTLTKKMSEDLTDYLLELGVRVRYLHSEVDTIRRIELLKELRQGEYDVLVGHQPAPRGPRPARGVAGVDPGRRQGGVPAQRDEPHPDDRARGAQRLGPGPHVRRHDHAQHGEGDRRDEPPPGEAGRLQPRARGRPAAAAQAGRRHPRRPGPRGRRRRARRRGRPAAVPRQGPGPGHVQPQRERGQAREGAGGHAARGPGAAHPAAVGPDARGRPRPVLRARRPAARRGQRAEEGAARDGRRRACADGPGPAARPGEPVLSVVGRSVRP